MKQDKGSHNIADNDKFFKNPPYCVSSSQAEFNNDTTTEGEVSTVPQNDASDQYIGW